MNKNEVSYFEDDNTCDGREHHKISIAANYCPKTIMVTIRFGLIKIISLDNVKYCYRWTPAKEKRN